MGAPACGPVAILSPALPLLSFPCPCLHTQAFSQLSYSKRHIWPLLQVLSAPGPSALQQALAQALLGQYSTGEHAVPMRDVVSYVTGVLAVNGAAAALELIVPQVASEHLVRLAEWVRPVLQERVRRWQVGGESRRRRRPGPVGGIERVELMLFRIWRGT